MKHLKTFESLNAPKIFESNDKLDFSDLHADDIETSLLDEMDKGEVKVLKCVSVDYFDVVVANYIGIEVNRYAKYTLQNLFNKAKYDSDVKAIYVELELEHPWGDRGHAQFDYEGYMKATVKDYFKRFYNNYDVNIFYIVNYLETYKNPFCKVCVFIQDVKPTEISENVQTETNLIIIDVQKSFSKFFTDLYITKLNEYAKTFTNVYQIWDNHVDGKNVDKDYLYDKNPDKPENNDLYTFPNQREIIEKRYQYDVDADFYKKILDKKTYNIVKNKENKGLLRRGDTFATTEGTIIVYIGNKHVWYHTPKKLYDLFLKLKDKEVTMVGGSDQECYLDVEVTAKSMGVIVRRDFGYIYSATNCPIK